MPTKILTPGSIYRFANSRAIKEADRILNYLVAGEVDCACELLLASKHRVRKIALMTSIRETPGKNRRRFARAPSPEQQVVFFQRAIARVSLNKIERLQFEIALTYQAIEAEDFDVIEKQSISLEALIPITEVIRARTELSITRKTGESRLELRV